MTPDGSSLPVLTIGGYLGAGKTTLVNHLLRHAAGRRLAILVNEFGDLPIDEDLIEAEDDALISIAGGCICCSFGNDLIGALRDLAAMVPPPDHVIIESSGVAIPGAIVSTLSILDGVHSDGAVVVIDAETVRSAAADDYIGDTITRQLSDAEIVVLNKLDLIDEQARQALADWLRTAAPGAVQVPARFGKVAPEALLGGVSQPGTGHGGPHGDALFEAHVLTPAQGADADALARALATGGLGVVRAKGHVIGRDGACWRIQTVGKRYSAERLDRQFDIGLVCLGTAGGLDRPGLDALAN